MENPILKSLRENWMLLVFVVGFIASWTSLNARLTNAESKVAELDTTYEQIKQLQIDVAVIREKVSSESIARQVEIGVSDALKEYVKP